MAINKYWFISQIERSGKPFKVRGNNIAVVCPFHSDSKPSCNINLKKGKVDLGIFHCWSCGASGRWNKLAEKLKLDKLKGEEYENDPFNSLVNNVPDLVKTYLPPDTLPWKGSWRGLSEDFLSNFKPRKWYDPKGHIFRILFPVTVDKELKGYSSVVIPGIKIDQKTLNAEGDWILNSLFPFDFVKGNRVVLVEGIFDALRLLAYGIPTLSLLGTKWDNIRRSLLVQKGITHTLLCFDGDKAGRIANKIVDRSLSSYLKVSSIKLPISKAKYDPGCIPLNMILNIKAKLKNMK